MDSETKKRAIAIGVPILILIAFISAAASFGNNNLSGTTSTTTIKSTTTAIVYGTANAVVENYTDYGNLTIKDITPNTIKAVNETLSKMESNGSIYTYIYSNGVYEVELGTASLYGLRNMTSKISNSVVSGIEYVSIPKEISMGYDSQHILVSVPATNYTVYVNSVQPIGTVLPVKITAQITSNGTVFDNQIELQSA